MILLDCQQVSTVPDSQTPVLFIAEEVGVEVPSETLPVASNVIPVCLPRSPPPHSLNAELDKLIRSTKRILDGDSDVDKVSEMRAMVILLAIYDTLKYNTFSHIISRR